MSLATPKNAAWKVTAALAVLPMLFVVIIPTLTAWLSGTSPDFREMAHDLAGLMLILLPTWIALFLNHPHVVFIFSLNLLGVLMSLLCLAGISVVNWVSVEGQAWWAVLASPVALIWSLINSQRPAAPEADHSAPPISPLTAINT